MTEYFKITDALQTGLMLVVLILLLYFAHTLQRVGAFDPLQVTRARYPKMLIATLPTDSSPQQSEIMERLSAHAERHGVEEDRDILDEAIITRGQTIGIYHVASKKSNPSHQGVILETGSRITPSAISAWRKRMSPTECSITEIKPGDVLQIPFIQYPGKSANWVMRWRVFRRLKRRAGRINVKPEYAIQTFSPTHNVLLTAIPISPLSEIPGPISQR